jgi:hypothetical protein
MFFFPACLTYNRTIKSTVGKKKQQKMTIFCRIANILSFHLVDFCEAEV